MFGKGTFKSSSNFRPSVSNAASSRVNLEEKFLFFLMKLKSSGFKTKLSKLLNCTANSLMKPTILMKVLNYS